MKSVHAKLNPTFSWQSWHSINRRLLSPVNKIKFKEETTNVLHLKHIFLSAEASTLQKADKKN
jgi:hypothetical protein